jgi:hypothetical protein
MRVFTAATALCLGLTIPGAAQLGRQQGLADPNVTHDTVLLKLPGITPAIVQSLKDARPILSIVALDSILAASSLTEVQRAALYPKLFVHVDINRGSDAELRLIPGLGAAHLTAIKAGRPWKTFDALRTPLGADAVRIEQYLFIPVELNTFTDDIMDTFASIGVGTRRWKHEFAEYRPWKTMEQFDREIGKYVRGNPKELQRLKRYVIIAP